MSDLTDFLNARLDDDEAWAKAGFDAEWPEFNEPGTPGHHARVLADVAAKRRIVQEADWLIVSSGLEAGAASGWRTLRSLATVYADHPDYRPEWRP